MIVSLNLRTKHGTPGWFDLVEPSKIIAFQSKTNQTIQAYLGNVGRSCNKNLPIGFSVNKNALHKNPFCFSKKTLYLEAVGMMLLSKKGEEHHISIPLFHSIACVALTQDEHYFAYLVVEPSNDQRFQYWPVLVR